MFTLLLHFAFAYSLPNIQEGYYELLKGDQECSSGNVRWIKTEKEQILVISETYYFNFSNSKKVVSKSEDSLCTNTTYTRKNSSEINVKIEEKCKNEAIKIRLLTLNYDDPRHLLYSGSVSSKNKILKSAQCEWKKK
ncbi:MAG: hypothetical protein KDD37_00540 [Bdellovibrionales bacterium]|nr:hypothetical protein [Bdellovibrionales bacterium]